MSKLVRGRSKLCWSRCDGLRCQLPNGHPLVRMHECMTDHGVICWNDHGVAEGATDVDTGGRL